MKSFTVYPIGEIIRKEGHTYIVIKKNIMQDSFH